MFLVPSFVRTGNAACALENFVTEWGGVSFNVRGTPFEKYVLAEIRNRCSTRAERGITIQGHGGKDLEFDILALWEGYVLLVEAKCEKAVFSAADYFRAKKQIEKSIDQLVLRRQALPQIWSALPAKAAHVGVARRLRRRRSRSLCLDHKHYGLHWLRPGWGRRHRRFLFL